MKCLLSGASGLLGSAIRSSLLASGAEVLQLVRKPPAMPGQMQWNPSADPPPANIEPDTGRLSGLDAAIHLSGASVAAHRWTSAYRREMWTSRIDSTSALSRLLAGLPRPPRTVLVASATGFYGDRGDDLLDEDSSPGAGFLADLCREWEEAASPAIDAGIRVTHMRFGVVLSSRGGALERMLPAFRIGMGGRLGSGRQWMSWVHLDDAVAAVRFILEKSQVADAQPAAPSLTGPVNITSPHPVTNAEFTRALAARLRRPAIMPVPAFVLRLFVGSMADEALLASQRVLPKRLAQAGFRFTRATIDEALAASLG